MQTNNDTIQEEAINTEESAPVVKVDFISMVTEAMREGSHPNPEGWTQGLSETVVAQISLTDDARYARFIINERFRIVLGEIQLCGAGNTMDERYCLIEDGSVESWIKLYKQKIIPCLVKHQIFF